jgi:hypothetical protein
MRPHVPQRRTALRIAERTDGKSQPGKAPDSTTSPSTKRRLSVYDGRLWLGDFVWNEKTQQAWAWDTSRRFIGEFGSYRAAARAIGRHAAAEQQAAELRHRLDDRSPPFVTGLPEHFLRRS